MGPGLLFGNFVATNKEGKAYALCYNTSDEMVAINTPSVTLEPYEHIKEKDELFDGDSNNGYEEVELERANVLRMVLEEEKDRPTRIFELIDPDTLKGLDEQEIEHIKELINERPHIFGLSGEQLKATHITLNIVATLPQCCFAIFAIFANIPSRLIRTYATLRQYCWSPMISVFPLLL